MEPQNTNNRRVNYQPQRRIFDDFSSAYYRPANRSSNTTSTTSSQLNISASLNNQNEDIYLRQVTQEVISENPTPSLDKVDLVVETTSEKKSTKKRRLGLPRLHSWQEFRIFSAGALFALGLLTIGFYFGVTRPSTYASVANSNPEEAQVIGEDGTHVEVDQGVEVKDVDHRPAPPIVGSMPKKIRIPSIGVDAPIRSLGLTKSGALAVPNYLWQVGWYDQSSRPGEPGTVVMDGHFNGNEYAVFRKLHTLEAGSEISIERGDGQVITYSVESKEVFSKDAVPMDRLIGGDGTEQLHIITCDGTWMNSERTFDNRLVVFAKRKS